MVEFMHGNPIEEFRSSAAEIAELKIKIELQMPADRLLAESAYRIGMYGDNPITIFTV
jgi:hypothetical protein